MPKGKAGSYKSARLVTTQPGSNHEIANDSARANRLIQAAISNQLGNRGITFDSPSADLVVGYLILRQNNASTEMVNDYFGYGRDSNAILDLAHTKGVNETNRADFFKEGAVVIDLIDARTNKLIYRNFAVRDISRELSDAAAKQVIDSAVAEALGDFLR